MKIIIEQRDQAITITSAPILLPPGIDTSNADNQISWLTTTMLEVAKALEMPEDQTMKDLPALAMARMLELRKLRK